MVGTYSIGVGRIVPKTELRASIRESIFFPFSLREILHVFLRFRVFTLIMVSINIPGGDKSHGVLLCSF